MKGPGEWAEYKAILEQKQADLLKVLRKRDEIAIEKSADELDEVQRAAERELAVRNLNRESRLLRDVKAALRRIADGSYGVCVHCEEEISPKRIAAVPWTPFCLQCQEAADHHERAEPDSWPSSNPLMDAA